MDISEQEIDSPWVPVPNKDEFSAVAGPFDLLCRADWLSLRGTAGCECAILPTLEVANCSRCSCCGQTSSGGALFGAPICLHGRFSTFFFLETRRKTARHRSVGSKERRIRCRRRAVTAALLVPGASQRFFDKCRITLSVGAHHGRERRYSGSIAGAARLEDSPGGSLARLEAASLNAGYQLSSTQVARRSKAAPTVSALCETVSSHPSSPHKQLVTGEMHTLVCQAFFHSRLSPDSRT